MLHRWKNGKLKISIMVIVLAISGIVIGAVLMFQASTSSHADGDAPTALTLVQHESQREKIESRSLTRPNTNLISISSCASTGCHGKPGTEPSDEWRTSYAVWANQDPHADAYRTLKSRQSDKILSRLSEAESTLRGSAIDQQQAKQMLIEKRCVACHSTVSVRNVAQKSAVSHGVDCQSCHGEGAGWLDAHVSETWDGLTPEKKNKLGFVDLKSIDQRVRTCAGCHIGNGDQDMNHDLIAAGHPRLLFDFASFMQRMPQHWDGSEDPTELWETGQVETTRVAVELLGQRAGENEAGKTRKVWPEFAEYDCLNCHHELAGSWYNTNDSTNARLGELTWGSWNAPLHVWSDSKPNSESTATPLGLLRTEMHRRQPDAEKVVELCNRVAATLQRQPLISTLQRQPQLDWDSVAHWYFAALARYETLKQRDQEGSVDRKQLVDRLIELKSHLHVPFDDPQLTGGNSRRFDAATIGTLIDSIREQLELETGK